MQRRSFMKTASIGLISLGLPLPSLAQGADNSKKETEGPWRSVDLKTVIHSEIAAPAHLWLPMPRSQTSYQELLTSEWSGNFSKAGLAKDEAYGDTFFWAQWDKPGKVELSLTQRLRLRDRAGVEADTPANAVRFLQPTRHIPLDGIVKETAQKIVKSEKSADKKARLIYEWISDNASRDAKVRGCGLGDVKTLLLSGNLAGKCADLSSLFVGLCRAVDVPAREVFGLRVLPSEISKSIGKVGDISKAQHCRAEYYSHHHQAWVPVDPADVRKVILEENLPPTDAHVQAVRKKLFGFWEMNWVAFNSARDFDLPNSTKTVNFLMYPLLVSGADTRDGMEPEKFQYTLESKPISSARS